MTWPWRVLWGYWWPQLMRLRRCGAALMLCSDVTAAMARYGSWRSSCCGQEDFGRSSAARAGVIATTESLRQFCKGYGPGLFELLSGVHGQGFTLYGEGADLNSGLDQAQLFELFRVLKGRVG